MLEADKIGSSEEWTDVGDRGASGAIVPRHNVSFGLNYTLDIHACSLLSAWLGFWDCSACNCKQCMRTIAAE